MKAVLTLSFLTLFAAQGARAGECVLTINRTACPGKETQALKPYQGKNPTEEKKTVADEAACKGQGEKAAKIVRKGTLSSKAVSVKFDGKAVGDFSDNADCK